MTIDELHWNFIKEAIEKIASQQLLKLELKGKGMSVKAYRVGASIRIDIKEE